MNNEFLFFKVKVLFKKRKKATTKKNINLALKFKTTIILLEEINYSSNSNGSNAQKVYMFDASVLKIKS